MYTFQNVFLIDINLFLKQKSPAEVRDLALQAILETNRTGSMSLINSIRYAECN